ncbi:MAG: hypothetical protein ACLUPV_04515 [Bilophila wadsworthia]|uniref:hypothetical protein n=1 Tax=Bilophila wadsworthia TaxID=35833 RepID=UPI0032203C3F
MKKTVTTSEVAMVLGVSEAEVEKKAIEEGWVSTDDMRFWGNILCEAKKQHDEGIPHFIIWLNIIQMCEQRVLNQDTLMALIKDNNLCIIKD